MKTKNIFTTLFILLYVTVSFAQNDTTEKIIGCWVLKNIDFSQPTPNGITLKKEAINTTVCFDEKGTFVTKPSGNNKATINGNYKVSEDGKTLQQTSDLEENDNYNKAEITQLDDKNLVVKHEFGMMYFEREK